MAVRRTRPTQAHVHRTQHDRPNSECVACGLQMRRPTGTRRSPSTTPRSTTTASVSNPSLAARLPPPYLRERNQRGIRLAWLADRVRLVYIKGGDAGKAPLRLTATGADGAEAVVHDSLIVNETAPCAPARRDWQRLAGLASRCFGCTGTRSACRAARRKAGRCGSRATARSGSGAWAGAARSARYGCSRGRPEACAYNCSLATTVGHHAPTIALYSCTFTSRAAMTILRPHDDHRAFEVLIF